jgi:hypothetical protein
MENLKTTVDAGLNRLVTSSPRVPGVVAMATDRQRNIYEGAAGKRRLDRDADMSEPSRQGARPNEIANRSECNQRSAGALSPSADHWSGHAIGRSIPAPAPRLHRRNGGVQNPSPKRTVEALCPGASGAARVV